MSHLHGYHSARVALSGTVTDVIPPGTIVQNVKYINSTATATTISGTVKDSASGSENYVVRVPANDTVVEPEQFYTAGGVRMIGPVGTEVSFRYGTTRKN